MFQRVPNAEAGANLGQCRYGNFPYGAHSATVNQPWSGVGASTITLDGSLQAKIDLATFLPLTFKMGGIYHLCYSDDGSFDPGHTDIVPQRIEVYGIYDTRTECAEDETCLTKRPYTCFLRRQAYNNMEDAYDGTTSCVIDYSYDGAGFRGLPGGGRGSWTGEFATNYDSNGMVTTEILRSCGSSGVRMNVPPGRPDLQGPTFKAYAACYCPDFQRCDSFSPDYVQQVGLLYFFATKVCPNGFEAVACALDFTGAAPQHRFALKVECPSTACTFAATSRVKVVMQEANNNLPAWDPSSGCGAAVHGINALGVQVLPSDDNPDVATMNGGMRQDYKIWNFKNSSSGLIFDTKTSGFQFRIHLERRSLHRELRKEEHHAASKLAQVGMELWSEYRDDIHESHEAQMLMKLLNVTYQSFEARVKATVDETSKDLGLNKEKAAKLADTLLHLVADQQQMGLKHTKRLVDHLVEAGKRAVPLEKHTEKEVLQEMQQEEKMIEEEGEPEYALPGDNETGDPLKGMLEGFFWVFNDYEREFSGKPRSMLHPGNAAYDALKSLDDKMNDLTEAQIAEELDKIDLGAVGAGLGSGRVLPAKDIVEELLMIGNIPHKELRGLEEAWKSGQQDSVQIFGRLAAMHEQHKIPSGWLQRGIDEDEREEIAEEEQAEKLEVVCFCDGGCTVTANWFKVGQLRFAPFQPVSAASNVSVLQDEFILEYMNTPGTFGFYRPWVDYGVMGLQEGGALKLVSDPDLTMTDEGCVSAEYSRTLVDPNTMTIQNAATAYSGKNNAAADVNKLMFNNAIMANTIIVNQAGFVAVCYCARPVDDTPGVCAHDQWVMVNRLTIRGPGPGQSSPATKRLTADPNATRLLSASEVVFRIEYSGWGLAKDDKVRIIPATSQCSDVNGNPRAAWGVTSIKVGCPHPCSEVGEINDVLNGDISVGVLSSDSYMCDIQNEGCRTNDIKAVTVMDEFTTELEFEGRYDLADRLDNHNSAPNEYIAGHAVTVDPTDSKKVTIRVGWPDPKPQFTVQYINNRRGRWQRHSKAITAEEIMGEKERIDMKVCWKYTPAMGESGPAPRHVAEVGTLTMLDPNSMSECLVSLTTLVKKQMTPYAPMILSFRTATAETGKRYESLEGRMRLRIYFVRTVALRATFTDGAIIEDNQGEDELNEARQYICGKLFREVWSSDEELGFPMPRGCYYRTYGQTQELNMLFDRKNGLSPGKYYQVVLMGVAMDEAIRDGEYVHIFTTDDVDLHPYIALERGIATLYRSPQDPAYGSQGVKFAETDGVKISSGSGTEMLELEGGTELRLELKGDPLGGGISASAVLRLYLWPLTQWNVANACTVMCIAHDQVSAPCGAVQDCKGDAIIPNFQQNFLRIVLPSAMATMTEFISHTLVFPDLVLPTGGFFSTRLAAQISKADDTKPHYTVSSGDYIYKMHDEGVGVGKLVEFYGDGDQSPYRGDDRNILYANLVLPSTLFAAVQTGDAYMTLTLPTGYECVRTPDINGESPWRAEDDLGVFQGKIPQGTGSPDEGGGTRGWSVNENQCVYTLRQNAVIYAGSSLYIRVTANNPDTALQRMDPTNRWQVSLTSKGYHQYEVTFPPVTFNTVMQNFSSNTAVLGKITQPLIVPSNWMYSEGGVVMAQGFLNIFFRSEQGTGVESSVHVEAPAGFSFSPNPCRVQDLEDVYYSTPGQMGSPTHSLPGIVSCDHRSYPYNHAAVKLTGAILSNSNYAFGLWVSNAEVYAESQRTGWRIYTLDMNDFKVDGTPMPIPALAHTATSLAMPDAMLSFGLYRAQINTQTTLNVQVSIESSVPYTMSMQRTWVTVLPLRVGEQITSTLRVGAPLPECTLFNAPARTESLWLMGATGTLPGRYPQRQGNILLWGQARMYWPNETYGFQTYIRVPDRTPSAAPNWFIFEFGYDGNSLATRHAASAVPAPSVQSLTNAAMEYNTNVEGKVNPIIFQIQTISQIPAGGGLFIEGPLGFEFPNPCTPEVAPAARGATYQVEPMAGRVLSLPMEVACSFQQTTGPTGRSIIRLTAGASGIMPGLYRFQLLGKNPATAVANSVDNTKPCMMQFCWDFHSLQVIGNVNTKLDSSISIPSFDINVKMVEALIPELTREQQAATGRDDRPLSRNPLVFKFKLGSAAIFSGTMLIRGPLGTIFREDCAEDIEVRPTEVFGTGQMLPEEYAVWPQGVEIVSCRGEGPDARIVIDPGVTDGLLFEVFYPIRVAVLHNPVVQPIDNRWTLDFNGESSDPFDGYMLWTFTRTSLLTATMGRSTTVTGDPFLSNPVTFTFRPKNTVKGAGMIIRVEAPDSWTIAIEADGHCKIMMQPISADSAGEPPHPALPIYRQHSSALLHCCCLRRLHYGGCFCNSQSQVCSSL
ncbi:unnamed protein product [Symbiodinium necroappetens]|uniref:Uncharacterized protein n=1 Tax=Symbiodinium necroappetens TaxID=1628268 RepID=A0A812S1L9_9DINO|nr:unnamed protein product [Symbiodinium necroappetens]